MFHLVLAAVVMVAQVPAQAATPTPQIKPAYDVFGTTLTPGLRSQISADRRCKEAADETDAFAKSKGTDVETGLKAMMLLETCATLPRVTSQLGAAGSDWNDYRDYLLTAAAAIAYQLGFITGQPIAYIRAEFDAGHVRGFDAPQSLTVQNYGAYASNGSADQTLPFDNPVASDTNSAVHSMYDTMPMQNSIRFIRALGTHHTSGYAGPYGAQATAIADAAASAYNQMARAVPLPQATAPAK